MIPEKPGKNPYHWQGRAPERFVARRALLDKARDMCLPNNGGALLVLGTRGTGKSTFLARLREELVREPEIDVVLFDGPPLARDKHLRGDEILAALLERLLERLADQGTADPDELRPKLQNLTRQGAPFPLLDVYLEEISSRFERLVLLYDELDRYADDGRGATDFFSALEDARQRLHGRLTIVAAGGLDMLSLKTVLGSTLYVRAARHVLEPFDDGEIRDLAGDFDRRGTPLSDDVLATLRVLSGGNVALVTYGLQSLWDIETAPTPLDLQRAFERAFDRLAGEHDDFRQSIRRALFEFHESEIPLRVWQRLRQSGGRLPRSELESLRRQGQVPVPAAIGSKDILDMLRASGFIRMDDTGLRSDPIVAELIPSILSFDPSEASPVLSTLAEQLRVDLEEAMAYVHRMTTGFYRSETIRGGKKHILPEAAFAVALAAHLEGRGWKAELEAASGAGYSDIKARHPGRFGEEWAIIEVKHWENRDVTSIHDQVRSYFARGVTALATVVITDHQDSGWKDEYARKCLDGKIDGTPVWKALDAPLEGYFEARWGARVIEHFLLRLASRAKLTTA